MGENNIDDKTLPKRAGIRLRGERTLPKNPTRRKMSVDFSGQLKEIQKMNKKALRILAKRM